VHKGRIKKGLGLLLVAAIVGLTLTAEAQNILRLPERERLVVGDQLNLSQFVPQRFAKSIQVVVDQQHLLRQSGAPFNSKSFNFGEVYPVLAGTGHLQVQYLLFGLIPLKKVDVDVVSQTKVIPGGQSIGVMLQSQGVIVVGQSPITSEDGKKSYPAKEAGIKLGDVILQVDGKEVKSDNDVAQAVHQAGGRSQGVQVTLKRGSLVENKTVNPVFCQETKRYRIGLYVRDSAAGVGTMTFIDPKSGKYGALGHIINDADTNQKIEIAEGKVIASSIQSIQHGRKGQPGEKVGSFVQSSPFSGTITKNTKFGIFGTMSGTMKNPYYNQPIDIATESQIKEGPATILTVISGEKIEPFEINIERVLLGRADSKGMVVRVTDPKLLAATGGIVQGMSGSPIIQNGKLIGAVTHVFVNDPTRGYGCFIEHMLKEAEISNTDEAKKDAA
jgi:stage IV sporulation protein B